METKRKPEQFVRRADARQRWGGISRTTEWRWQRAGLLPTPVQLSPGVQGYLESEVQAVIDDLSRSK